MTGLMLRAVFRLALRQTEGLIASVLQLLGLDLPVPDCSALARCARTVTLHASAALTEIAIGAALLNRMLDLGRPNSIRVT